MSQLPFEAAHVPMKPPARASKPTAPITSPIFASRFPRARSFAVTSCAHFGQTFAENAIFALHDGQANRAIDQDYRDEPAVRTPQRTEITPVLAVNPLFGTYYLTPF